MLEIEDCIALIRESVVEDCVAAIGDCVAVIEDCVVVIEDCVVVILLILNLLGGCKYKIYKVVIL